MYNNCMFLNFNIAKLLLTNYTFCITETGSLSVRLLFSYTNNNSMNFNTFTAMVKILGFTDPPVGVLPLCLY